MTDLNKIAEQLVGLTLLQAAELKNILKDKYGIEPAAGAVAVAMPGVAAAAVEEKTEFNVVLIEAGAKKIEVIKEVRAITGLASRKPRTSSRPAARTSRKRSARPKPKKSRRSSRRPAPRSSSSKTGSPVRRRGTGIA